MSTNSVNKISISKFVFCGIGYVSSDVFTEIHVWEHDLAPDGSVARLQELTEFVEISNCIHEDRDDTASE